MMSGDSDGAATEEPAPLPMLRVTAVVAKAVRNRDQGFASDKTRHFVQTCSRIRLLQFAAARNPLLFVLESRNVQSKLGVQFLRPALAVGCHRMLIMV